MKNAVCAALLLALVFASTASAQTAPAAVSADDKELADLLSVLKQETEVATRTKLNSDYVPGIVTVLEGDQLEALGISTAGEALGLVPGMQAVYDVRSAAGVIVRGLSFPFNSGNIQLLVNSIPLARPDAGVNGSVLLMPIEQIERIEVIRGPGSVVYGDFAFMGLVNIITRRQDSGFFVRRDGRAWEGGGRAAWSLGPVAFHTSLSRWSSSDAPAPAPRRHVGEGRWFGVVSAEGGGMTAAFQAVDRSFRGPANSGPDFSETSWVGNARWVHEMMPKVRIGIEGRFLHNDLSDTVSVFDGNLRRLAVDLTTDRFDHHSLLLTADTSISTIDHASHVTPVPGQPLGAPTPLGGGTRRRVNGVTIQDRIDLGSAVAVTAGLRRDDYSDLSSRTTPRAAVVWRVSDRHILKAQYAEGFRPPTFFERYQAPAPGVTPRYPFEVNATTELNYVYRASGSVGRVTVFRERLHDLIRPGGTTVPGTATSAGYELEWSQQLTAKVKVDSTLSHVNAHDPRIPDRAPDPTAAVWLGNLAVSAQPWNDVYLTGRLNHVGPRGGQSAYDTIDMTLSKVHLFVPGLGIRLGVKNAGNDNVAYLTVRPTGQLESFDFPGRSVWLQLSWRQRE